MGCAKLQPQKHSKRANDTVLKSNVTLIIFSSRLNPREPLRYENYQAFDIIENSMNRKGSFSVVWWINFKKLIHYMFTEKLSEAW